MGARVSVVLTEQDGSRLRAVQAGEDWKGCVELRVRRPIRVDNNTGLVLCIRGEERVRIEANKFSSLSHEFFSVQQNLLKEGAPSSPSSCELQPGTYTYPFSISFPTAAENCLPTMHIRHDRGPTGISAHGRDMAYGSVEYKVTVHSHVQRIQVLPSIKAAPWLPRIVGPQAAEIGAGRIFWGAALDTTVAARSSDVVQLYVSLVNESIATIHHLRVELVETVSLSTSDVTAQVQPSAAARTFPHVLWRLERAPLDPDLEVGHKLPEHIAQTTPAELQVSSRAVLDDLEALRPQPIPVQLPAVARPSHTGRLTRTQHQLRLTLLTNKKNQQLWVPLWLV